MRPSIIVHGGAGADDPDDRESRHSGCLTAVTEAWPILQTGGTAVDAVVAAVVILENDPHFNAGVGSCFTSDGRVEMDASIMEGSRLSAGAVGAVERIQNPIRLARAVMDDTRHLLLVGPHALQFARAQGIAECDPQFLMVERQRRRFAAKAPVPGGTVGAVAVDAGGHLAAATSTGGIMGKLPGRVGDSAVIGAGTYADDRRGAASATGIGEAIMRMTLAREAVALLADGRDPTSACEEVLATLQERLGARCGLVLVDSRGRLGAAYTTEAMPVAYMHGDLAEPVVLSECAQPDVGAGGQRAR